MSFEALIAGIVLVCGLFGLPAAAAALSNRRERKERVRAEPGWPSGRARAAVQSVADDVERVHQVEVEQIDEAAGDPRAAARLARVRRGRR